MSERTYYDKAIEKHTVVILPSGQIQLFVGKHLVHEVTSPPAFEYLEENGLKVLFPNLTQATLDHVIPTGDRTRPFADEKAEAMAKALEDNVKKFGIPYFETGSGKQGIVHVASAEQGIVHPGMVVVCGDSHTCTYGAFGALAFGIGTTQVRDVLATQTVAVERLKVRRINFNGELQKGVSAKDLAIYKIRTTGVEGGIGFFDEYGGSLVSKLGMEPRMTICNLAVEGGSRGGYFNPDEITYAYLWNAHQDKTTEFSKQVINFGNAKKYWASMASDKDAIYDDILEIYVNKVEPMVTWGTNPAQAIGISEKMPQLKDFSTKQEREEAKKAYEYMGLKPGQSIYGLPIDQVFIGSCTNGRLSDLEKAANIIEGKKVKVKTSIVPGSEKVKYEAEKKGLHEIFIDAGAEWKNPGCSSCLGMVDPIEDERVAAISNRNFEGRQGPKARTHLMGPEMAAYAAIKGRIEDVREYS